MSLSRARLRDQLVRHEGLRLKPYRCTAGKLTIGVGRNLDDVGVTAEEAAAMLDHDVDRVVVSLSAALPWWRTLDEARQAVLVNMGFNLGVPGLLKFKQTLAHVEAGRYAEAAEAMLDSVWAKQVGRRAVELAEIMRSGRWTS